HQPGPQAHHPRLGLRFDRRQRSPRVRRPPRLHLTEDLLAQLPPPLCPRLRLRHVALLPRVGRTIGPCANSRKNLGDTRRRATAGWTVPAAVVAPAAPRGRARVTTTRKP